MSCRPRVKIGIFGLHYHPSCFISFIAISIPLLKFIYCLLITIGTTIPYMCCFNHNNCCSTHCVCVI